jgi:RNA polymerase sigma factor (sigma-70 family)
MMTRSIEEYRERLRAGTTRPLPDYPEGSPQKTCMENDALAAAAARRHFGRSDDDAIQAGRMGILRAIELFDPEKAKFSTYATIWIRNRIVMAMRDAHLIHTPRQTKGPPDAAHRRQLAAVQDAEYWSIDGEHVQVADGWADDIDETERIEGIRGDVGRALRLLAERNPRMAEAVAGWFGLDGREPEKLQEIGDRLGITKERVRQLKDRGLKILAKHLRSYAEAS